MKIQKIEYLEKYKNIVQKAVTEVFYLFFIKRFDHLEPLMTIYRPKQNFSWVTVRVFSAQSPV